jgi:hypothetical protein
MQVCVPRDWTDDQAREFADGANPCGTENGWQIRRSGVPALNGAPERVQCSANAGYVHIMLDA